MRRPTAATAIRQALGIVSWTAGAVTLGAAVLVQESAWLIGPAVALLMAGMIESEF